MQDEYTTTLQYMPGPLTQHTRNTLTPEDIIALMLDGNQRFRTGCQVDGDVRQEQRGTTEGQHPAAISLTCMDSRTPIEIICDLGIGDAFNARIAGCVVNDDILGSMEYACALAGARLVVVMGHTECGAIKGAIDDVIMGNLTGLLASIKLAISETEFSGERNSQNSEFVKRVTETHILRMITVIRERSTILRDLETEGCIKIIGCIYDIHSARISLL